MVSMTNWNFPSLNIINPYYHVSYARGFDLKVGLQMTITGVQQLLVISK